MDINIIKHQVPGSKFPTYTSPNAIPPTPEGNLFFNPSIHLQLEKPAFIKTLNDTRIPYPVPPSTSHQGCNLAYTAPFRVLSEQGIQDLRIVIKNNEQFAGSNNRQPKSLRGIGYRSKFIRDFTYSKEMLNHLSLCTGKTLHPHDMGMNVAQINFGKINGGAADVWHIDSVPYVMVLLLSDATDMIGGKLQVARISDPTKALDIIYENGELPEELIDTVNYPGAGYCIFMQGSRIAHAVTPVLAAREERLTLVNSYQSLQPFDEDRTIFSTFNRIDGEAPKFEYARHQAWRASGKLDYLLNSAKYFGNTAKITEVLDYAIKDLQRAKDLINETIVEQLPWSVDAEESEKDVGGDEKSKRDLHILLGGARALKEIKHGKSKL